MQIIIEIPKSEIPKQQNIIEIPLHFIDGKLCKAGGYEFDVLPKGHGRLFDEKDIINGNYEIIGNKIYEVEPIIEADKESGE